MKERRLLYYYYDYKEKNEDMGRDWAYASHLPNEIFTNTQHHYFRLVFCEGVVLIRFVYPAGLSSS